MFSSVNAVRFHPDGTCIAACSADKTIKIWDNRSPRILQHYTAHQDVVNEICFHPTGNFLFSCSNDSTIKIWDLREGLLFYTISGHQGPIHTVNISAKGYVNVQ